MNERIKQLANQAGGVFKTLPCGTEYRSFYTDDPEGQTFDVEKFAELIVRECDRVIKDSVSTMERGKLRASIARAGTLIKEHFGVE